MSDYKLLRKYPACQGNVMDFYECEIGLPDGSVTHWDLIHHPGGAAVLPIDDDGKLILERQYRIGADAELLEIPAGKSEPGEDPMDTVRREMEEEIGYTSDDIELLVRFAPAPAYSEELTTIFLARNLKKTATKHDDDEFLSIERYDVDSVVEMINSGELIDGKTIAAVMTYKSLYL